VSNDHYHSYRIEAPELYTEVVTHFYIARNESETAITRNLIPSFQAILVFNFGSPATMTWEGDSEIYSGNCLLFRPIKKQLNYTLPPGCELLVVNFKDDALYRIFGDVMPAIIVPIHPDVFMEQDSFSNLWVRLSPMDTMEKRIEAVLDFCQPYLRERTPIAAELADAQHNAQSEVKMVAAELEVSERTVQKEYKKQFGFTSKEKQRFQRFLNTVRELQNSNGPVDWQDLIYRFGYYDQSHLIKDFNHYLGITPEQYLSVRDITCLGNPG
jgi:AraC-like DNA-binding protein